MLTTYNETPLFFSAGEETLFGVITEPDTRRGKVGVVLLRGGGQGPSAGRNQTSARLCRRLADEGFIALRFDYRGVGESTGTVDRFSLAEPFTEDLEGAVDSLRGLSIDRLALIGGCFGARTALSSAPTLTGLEGVVLLTLPVRDKEKDEVGTRSVVPDRTAWGYARRVFRPHVILGALRHEQRQTYLRVMKAAWRARAIRKEAVRDPYWLSRGLLESLHGVLKRDIPLLIICGTRDPGYQDFRQALEGDLGEMLRRAGALVTIVTLEGRVEAFAEAALHDTIIDHVAAWLSARCRAP